MHRHPWLAAGALALACGTAWPQAARPVVTLGQPVAVDSLARLRGGSSEPANDTRLVGTTAGNTAHAVQTGSNSISSGAFADLAGIPVVIQNTGANVLIQSAVIVNVLAH